MLYRSTTTPEAVLVEFERFQRFITFENETEFWDERVEELRSGASGSVVKDRRIVLACMCVLIALYPLSAIWR